MIWALYAGIAIFWLAVIAKVRRSRREGKWRLGPDAAVDLALPRLAVVIPARDEATQIVPCIEALRRSDHPNFDVRVFDDASSDGTGDLARAAGVAVATGDGGPLPAGWKGKPWALQRATREIDADWILFLDADVRVEPAALSRAHAVAVRDGLDLVSGFGRLTMESFWEKVIQPSVGGLILAGNDLDAVNDPARRDKVIANGQFILVRRSAYEAVGGHEAVRDDILDDVGLAKAFVAKDLSVRCYLMRELFSCRMYTNLRELWYGWTKNLYAGLEHRRDRVVFLCAVVFLEFIVPYLALGVGVATGRAEVALPALALIVLIHGVRFWMDGMFGQDRRYGLLQPLGAAMLLGLLIDSGRRSRAGTVLWKGRRYAVGPAGPGSVGPGSAGPGTSGPSVLGLVVPLVAVGSWLSWSLGCVDRHEEAIRPLGGLAYATFVQIVHNWSSGAGWTQTIHQGYADEWRWGGHYTPMLFVTGWLASLSASPWGLARVQAVAVGLGAFAAWKLGKDEARLPGGVAALVIYLGSGATAMLALADYQDLVLLVPATPLVVWAARHAPVGVFLACAALYAAVREEALLILPFVGLAGGLSRAALAAAVSGAFLCVYAQLDAPPYPNPLRDILHNQWRATPALPNAFGTADWALYRTLASTAWPWMGLAPIVAIGGVPVLVSHWFDPTGASGLDSPAVHHFSPYVGIALSAAIVGIARLMRIGGRLWAWGLVAAVLGTACLSGREWEERFSRHALRMEQRESEGPHPAWELLARVPPEAVVLVPDAIAPAAALRRWVVTADSVGDRVEAARVKFAVDDGALRGTVVARAGRWRLLADPVVTARARDVSGGPPVLRRQ